MVPRYTMTWPLHYSTSLHDSDFGPVYKGRSGSTKIPAVAPSEIDWLAQRKLVLLFVFVSFLLSGRRSTVPTQFAISSVGKDIALQLPPM